MSSQPVVATPAANPTTPAAVPGAVGAPAKHENTSLYVGDLSADVTEAILYDLFKASGAVASIRVCRNSLTRQSLGYAYVNFVTSADAEHAMESLNYKVVKGKPIRIMWSCRDPKIRRDTSTNVFIKNLHKSIDEKLLSDTFQQFGTILSCKIQRDETGESRGHGFVHFETQEAADLAIAKANGVMLMDMEVFVGPFQPRRERQEKYTNLYIKNIPKTWNDETLRKYFEGYGEIKSAVVMKDDASSSKGFGFVNFGDPVMASKAATDLNGKIPEGSDEALYVDRAMKKTERERHLKSQRSELSSKYQGVNLFVKNLDEAVDDAKLTEAFKQYGSITSALVKRNDKGQSSGMGFVCFHSPEEAQRAITEMNGKMLGTKPIYVALHEPKEVRKAKLEAQFQARAVQRLPIMGSAGMFPVSPASPVYYAQGMAPRQPYIFPQAGMAMPRQGGGGGGNGGGGSRPAFGAVPSSGAMPQGGQGGQGQGGQGGQGGGGQGGGMRRPPTGGRGGRGGGAPSSRGGAMGGRGGARGGYKGGKMEEGANPINPASLAAMSDEERRAVLGNALFAVVQPKNPTNAKKIVGMLLEGMDTTEILAVLENESALDEKIQEAVETLTSSDMPEIQAQ